MISVIAEHSVDLSLLPEKAKIMDIGCLGFLFTNELERLGHNVYPIDIQALTITGHYRCAIAGKNGACSVKHSKDPQATTIIEGSDIPMFTIKGFSEFVKVDFWDLIKIDIEGSEYEVIMSLTEPPAKQLSIEFHLHTGVYNMKQMDEMYHKLLSLGYEPVSHEMTRQHGLGMNYWDSLFVLVEKRKEYSEPTNY